MRSTIAVSVAALVGSALAAPALVQDVNVVVETVVQTVYQTEGATSTSTYYYQAPTATTTIVYTPAPTSETPTPTPTPVYTPTPEPTSTVTPTSTSVAAAAASPSAAGYMGIVSEWRAKLGMKDLEQSSELESNSMNCLQSSPGTMTHKLNPGTYGQVLAPGESGDAGFLKVFVGGWLCEIPTLSGLDGVCTTMSEGWSYEGQTGHAKILTSDSYSKIGCSFFDGIWGCDLA